MSRGWLIRKATAGDADALFRLVVELAISFRPNREAFDVSLAQLLVDPAAWLCVAEEASQLIGYCLGFDHYTFFANGRVSWVEEIIVEKGKRNRNVGRSLMEAFERWARDRNSKIVALGTTRAAPFYLALGYKDYAKYFRKILK